MEEQKMLFNGSVYDPSVCKQVYAEAMMVTPEMAERFLTKNTQNRKLDQNRVQRYANEMRGGFWILNGESIAFDNEGTLVNGQHRLAAVIKAGIEVPFLVVQNVPTKSFLVTDTGKNRTSGDVFGINGTPSAKTTAAGIQVYCDLKGGLYSINSCIRSRLPREMALSIYNENSEKIDEVVKYCRCISTKFIYHEAALYIGIYLYLLYEKKYTEDTIHRFFDWYAYPPVCKCNSIYCLRERLTRAKNNKVTIRSSTKIRLYMKTWSNYIDKKWNTKLVLSDDEKVEFK